jgi:DNA modification methylase
MNTNTIIPGNCIETLKTLPDKSIDCCVTSPPYYGLRDYGATEQIGTEATPYEYVKNLSLVFSEVYRVLKDSGTLWLNIGDCYAGSGMNSGNSQPPSGKQAKNHGSIGVRKTIPAYIDETLSKKSLMGVPWRLAFALQEHGWILRQDIIWSKLNCMPESVNDRFCKSHEYIFLFAKQTKYYFNSKAALEPALGYDGRKDTRYKGGDKDTAGGAHERWPHRGYTTNPDGTGLTAQNHGCGKGDYLMRVKRDVWAVSTEASSDKHYAMFPQKLILPCILCGCPPEGVVLDPFMGSGTTGLVAKKLMRKYIGCEINPEYVEMANKRLANEMALFD